MSKDNIIAQNTFLGGMNQDNLDSLADKSTYWMARNAVHSTRESKNFGLSNEGSNTLVASVDGIVGSLYCEERNWTVLFQTGDRISIFIHATGEIKEVMNAGEFGCSFGFSDCEWIGNGRVEFKSMDPCAELTVYFSAGCEYYKVNLDLMLDPERKAGLIRELNCDTKCGLTDNCEYFKVFKQGCAPKITPKAFENGGGGGELKAGAYTFVARFLHTDGGETNWFHFSDRVNVGSEHNIAGEPTSSYIEVTLSGLDCKFSSIELAVIEEIGGIITAKTLNNFNYNSNSFSYRYNGTDGTPIDIRELLAKEHTYLRGKYLQQKDGHMLYYGIQARKNPNLQPLVNQIETEYVVYEVPYEHVKKYNIKSLMRGETYAFSLTPNYIDGSHGKAFHIPATPAGGGNAGNQVSSVSDNFKEQPNDNANLAFTGGFSFRDIAAPEIASDIEVRTQFRDTDVTIDGFFDITTNPGDYDVLDVYFTGNTAKTNFIKETAKSIALGEDSGILLRNHSGDTFTFKPLIVSGQNPSSIRLSGTASQSTNGSQDAAQITLGINNNPSQSFKSILGGTSSPSAVGAGAQAQVAGNASITRPQEVERKREPREDRPFDPQNDHYDTVLQNMVDNMETTASIHTCEELKLWEDHLNAHCCWCYEGTTICADDGFSPVYGGQGGGGCENPVGCCGTGDPCGGGAAYQQCLDDLADAEEAEAKFEDLLDFYIQDDLNPQYTSERLYQGARKIQESIRNRERLERKRREYNIVKNVSYGSGGSSSGPGPGPGDGGPIGGGGPNDGPILSLGQALGNVTSLLNTNGGTGAGGFMSGPLFDANGVNETEVDFKEVSSGRTEPDFEENITYPCQTDCSGEFIYGGLAGTPVAHHKFPDASREPHYVSKSLGVPYGTYWTDASETSDLYIRIMGVRFRNIQLPDEADLPLPLCPNNPFTIGMVKRTDSNRKVIMKGLATGTFRINNNGKDYDQPRYAVNSIEEVSYYHDDGDGGRLSNQGSGDSHTLYSLDGLTIRPSLHADQVVEELRLQGQGERYGLYAKGKDPDNALHGRRIDALGARQSINLNSWSAGSGEYDLDFKKYATGNEAISPASGGSVPLMNRSGQECIWFGSGLPQLTDSSFTGDVLEHNVPISDVSGQYVSFRRDLQNQYGNLENLNYMPLLQAGKNTGNTIEGPVGDIYIGPFSFVKTGFVSDKVGSCEPSDNTMFNIPAQVPTKNEMRCICDSPEDVIHSMNGAWVWTELPEDGDAANPKNWAGTQTLGGGPYTRTRPYNEAVGQASVSDMYFPGTVTTNITYIGEFETNPWLREKSDLLSKQWYSDGLDRSQYRFDSGVTIDGDGAGWRDCYLNQFHRELEQASVWQRVVKTIIRTSLNILFPMMGIENLFDAANGGIDFVGNLAEFPMLAVLWYLMVQVLFRNEMLDKLLGIPTCRSDDKGGFKEGYNKGLFFNPTGYNVDYSTQPDLYTYEGVPDPYYVCDCDDCPKGANVMQSGQSSGEIYISDRQIQGSIFDSYTHVKPFSKINIPANYGKLTNLFVVGGDLYAHTTDAIIPLRRNRAMVPSDFGEILLGAQGFILDPEGVIIDGITEGYAGLRRHNEHIDSGAAYAFIDGEADIVYLFRGQSAANTFPTRGNLEAISMKGMFNFFKEKLNFCNITECMDERVSGTSYYALGYDPRLNRILVTKSDGDASFTMSYDLEKGVWVSFHDYIPREYVWDRRDMYTINESGIWKHNSDCNFQTFYGQYYPHEVQFTAIPQDVDSFVWEGVKLNTEAEVCAGCTWVEDIDRTFNKMAFWNSTQGTGTMNVEFVSDNDGSFEDARRLVTETCDVRANKKRRIWRINDVKDYRKTDCRAEPSLVCDRCQPIPDINESIYDRSVTNKQNFRGKVLADKYFKYRFTYDLDADTKINTIYVNTYGKPSEL